MRTKLLKKDYNQELEEIAESKRFEKEAQNLLLSMLYKAEGAYNDYENVKREVPSKEEFIQNIIDIIKKYCREIVIAKPNSSLEKELTKSKCKILEEEPDNQYNNEQKVIFFPNEKVVLYSVIRAGVEKINSNLTLEEKAMITAISIGKCISYSEVIRDFNGFSWSQVTSEIENIDCNILYTDLIYLLGDNIVSKINSNNIKKLKKMVDKDIYDELQKLALRFYFIYDEKQKEKFIHSLQNNKKTLGEMNEQKKFVENISNRKKEMLKKIRDIDDVLNNQTKLRKEYLEKNSKLPNEKKIFSVSHYEEMLQKERNELLEEIEKCNKYQNPIEFVKIKTELENKVNYYESIEKIDIAKLQEKYLQIFANKIQRENSKEKILDYIYEIRYLKYLPINQKEVLKNKIDFGEIEKIAISKGLDVELINPISNNKETDYELLKSIFETKNMNLDELLIRLEVKNDKLVSEIYDEDILDSTNYINLQKGSNVKIRKTRKVKIFNK